jgi:hypothetical protein
VLGVPFLQSVLSAAFHASPAKGALAWVIAPGELAFAGLELDGARSAAEAADSAARAERWIELD